MMTPVSSITPLLPKPAFVIPAGTNVAANPGETQRSVFTSSVLSSASAEPFLSGTSSVYLEEMFEAWKRDPSSVHLSWHAYFSQVEAGAPPGGAHAKVPAGGGGGAVAVMAPMAGAGAAVSGKDLHDHLAIQEIIRAYQTRGHHIADLDPLGILSADLDSSIPPALVP